MAPVSRIAVLVLAAALAACVSTSTRAPGDPAPSKEEAAKYNLELGIGYLRQGNYQLARDKLNKSLEQNPDSATARVALGLVYERLEDPAGAEKQYRKAVDMERDDPDALNALAVFLCSQPKPDVEEALHLFDDAIAIPLSKKIANRPMLYTNAGTCAKTTDPQRAEKYLRSALAEDPRFPDALLQMAEVSMLEANPLQARAFYERFTKAGRQTPASLVLGIRIETALGDSAAVSRYTDQLQKQFPDSAEARALKAPGKG